MPARKAAQAPPVSASTRPRRAAASKAPAATPLPKSVSKTASAKASAPSSALSAAKSGGKKGQDSFSAATYAKEFRPVAAALAKKIIADVQSGSDSDNVSDMHAHAAIALATEALSKRIVAAVDEMSNPKACAPKATKQLAAKMAKIIVEAAATKADAPPSAFRTFSFTNVHGEEYQLTVDAAGRSGILAGDETDWQNLHIKGDALQDDFMFNREELAWLRTSWKAATGRDLKHPTLTAEEQLLKAGVVHRMAEVTGKAKVTPKTAAAAAAAAAAAKTSKAAVAQKQKKSAAKKK